ncbi:MAG: hypothetical protein K8F91_00335, partial [Candidatus Obscuribacterales bacterium]|nr:hypothetical protein [Candidatus Obscuribacterales bacterium]
KQKAARTIVEMTGKNKGVIASDNNPQLGNITIIDPAKQEEAKTGLDTAKDKLRGFLRGLSGEKK